MRGSKWLMFFVMGRRETVKTRIRLMSTALAAMVLGVFAVGCAAEEPEDKPYVPQITHSPQEPADDETGVDAGGGPNAAEDLEGGGSELEPPEIPDEIYENTLEGAEAAARYYFRAYEYGVYKQDTAPLEFICHEESSTCAENIATVKALQERNRTFTGGGITDHKTQEVHEYDAEVIMTIPITEGAITIYDEAGEVGSR